MIAGRCIRTFAALLLVASTVAADPLSDPTRPYSVRRTAGARAISEYSVSAVFTSAARRVAIVNGKVVTAGDRLGDVQIVEILADGVRYERHGRLYTIRIASLAMKVRMNPPKTEAARAESPTPESHEVSP
ncbi:MAG TPA: hypothetical protein VE046_14275 [Steroidobacteraceae bacterium]|nr:hypothetical protein [Steroidobacteraceae bacterium]